MLNVSINMVLIRVANMEFSQVTKTALSGYRIVTRFFFKLPNKLPKYLKAYRYLK